MKHKVLMAFLVIWLGVVLILTIIFVQQEPATVQQPIELQTLQINYTMPEPTPKPPTKTSLGEFKTYGYDICMECCGKVNGITASGVKAVVGVTVATDWAAIPKGTVIEIEGIGTRVVQDNGPGIKGRILDVLVSNHAEAYKVTNTRKVWIVEGEFDDETDVIFN